MARWYNWAFTPDTALADGGYRALGVAYVPMVWGGSFNASAVTAGIPDGACCLARQR